MFIDVHSHTGYTNEDIIVVQNIFPGQRNNAGNTDYFTTGVHPWFIKEENIEHEMNIIAELAIDDTCIAIGETGLDKVAETPFEFQRTIFEQHLDLAKKLKKPVILHCVRSYNEMQKYRSRSNQEIPWIFHWFNASAEVAFDLIRKNCYLSFGHMLYADNSKAFKAFPDIPLEHIFFETDDAGYSILDIYSRAAELKQVNLGFLQQKIAANFKRCFGIEV